MSFRLITQIFVLFVLGICLYCAHDVLGHGTVDVSQWFALVLRTDPSTPKAGKETNILLQIKDISATGFGRRRAADGYLHWSELAVTHARKAHLVIMSADQQFFGHVHPEDFNTYIDTNSTFVFKFTFPKAGEFRLVLDYAPVVLNGSYAASLLTVMVDGAEQPAWQPKEYDSKLGLTFKSLPLGPKELFTSSVDLSKNVQYPDQINPSKVDDTYFRVVATINDNKPIVAGSCVLMQFEYKDYWGKPLRNLSPYLSMPLHIAIAHTNMLDLDHTHGMLPMGHDDAPNCTAAYQDEMMKMMPSLQPTDKFGPKMIAYYNFTVAGTWRLVLQTSQAGQSRMLLATFQVKVFESANVVPSGWAPQFEEIPAASSDASEYASSNALFLAALAVLLLTCALGLLAPKTPSMVTTRASMES